MKARGVYIARLDIGEPHLLGVARKIDAQVLALTAALGPVETWFLRGLTVERNGVAAFRQRPGPLARQRLHAFGFYAAIAGAAPDADYIYVRHQRTTPALLTLLATLRRDRPHRPIIVEVPTWPYESEQLTPRDRMLGRVDRMTRGGLRRYVDRIVTFSAAEAIFGIPTVRTDNGVRTEDLPVVPAATPGGPVALVGVANLGRRHAYDRVIDGIADYHAAGATRPVRFDIIGSGSEEAALRARVAERGVQDRVRFLGPLSGAALDAALADCQIGVSGLGMHRIGADTSDIKSREYCARGLPFVIANTDRDFGPDFPFAFHAPMTEAPVDIPAVLAFVDGLAAHRPGYPTEMRAFAEARLTWTAKMAPVVAMLETLITADA
ncbi:MAG: glycosyltransferase [Caulobacter sp.]|nr:glycosyltransferase [Caulobacter sp.]